MNDTQALQVVDAGLRTLFANFVRRAIDKQPEAADAIRDVVASIEAGNHKIAFVVEIGSFELCRLSGYIVAEGDLDHATPVFTAELTDFPTTGGSGTVQ
jgi:hypothetical protein